MHIKPYIGVTGSTDPGQVAHLIKVFNEHSPGESERMLHVGVMMSRKTLNGIPSRYSNVFPKNGAIAGIFFSDEAYNCLHYADYENRSGFAVDLSRAIELCGTNISAIQLDMTWPDPAEIAEAIHRSRKQVEVILQVGPRAFEEIEHDRVGLVDRLEDYYTVINRVLLDRSAGKGMRMDAMGLLPFAAEVRKNFILEVVAAGGLGPETVHLAEPLLKEIPDLSIDAQGQLHPNGDILAGPMVLERAERYLVQALALFGQRN